MNLDSEDNFIGESRSDCTQEAHQNSGENRNAVVTDEQQPVEDARSCLSTLNDSVSRPLVEQPSASYLMEEAQQLVDAINRKRKNDTQLLEEFKASLDMQSKKLIQDVEEHLYQTYRTQSLQVDGKLQELFGHLGNIDTADSELTNFKESLRKLYQEMQTE